MTDSDRNRFIRVVIDLYLGLPDTAARRASRHDRILAGQLFDRGLTIELVRAAMLLASARRSAHADRTTPLQPIRSLHYFLPVVEELTASPPDPTYLRYLFVRFGHLIRRPRGQFATDLGGQ